MKKLLALFIAILMLFASCGDAKSDNNDTTDSAGVGVIATVTESTAEETEPEETTETTEVSESVGEVTEPTDTTEPTEDTEVTEPIPQGSTPLLYKVSDDDSVVWLMGSIHAGRDSFYPFPDYVNDAYEGADALAVECDVVAAEEDVSLAFRLVRTFMYTDGTTIADHIDSDLYESAKAIIKESGMYLEQFDYLTPVFWSQILDELVYEEAGINYDLGVDMHFLTRAKEEGKELLEIESVMFQYEMLAGFSPELQEMMLESSVETTAEIVREEIDDMMSVWESGDEKTMIEAVMDDDGFSEEEPELYKEYNDAIRVQRNIGMADFAEDALNEDKEVFICVGMAHVVGDRAMVELLRERGYTVDIVK